MTPMVIELLTQANMLRFWNYVQKGNEEKCWKWLGYCRKSTNGDLPSFTIRVKGKQYFYYSSRVAYYITYRIDPGVSLVLHKCDNTLCVNPNHLFLGNPKQNMQDMLIKNRQFSNLSEEKVREIRKQAQLLRSCSQIAKEYKVSSACVQAIVNKKRWAHI